MLYNRLMNTRHLRPEDLAGKRWRGLVRESTEAQADRWSPERQRDDLRRAGDELHMIATEPLFYERVGSGEAVAAVELSQALADGKAGQYDVLMVLHTSRFARNRAEAVRRKAEFARAGIIIYFAAQRLISGTYVGGLTEGISEVIDEAENEQRRFWVAGGLRQRQVSGRWVGAIPIGYRRVLVDFPDGTRGWDGALEPDPATAPIIRRIFAEAAAGDGTRRIAQKLEASTGDPWSERSVYAILRNRTYTGRLIRYPRPTPGAYYGPGSADGRADLGVRFPPLVEDDLWDRVQEGLTARRSIRPSRSYPLSGILRCTSCGYRMTGMHSGTTRYYRCTGRTKHATCSAPAIRAELAEAQFARWVSGYRLPDDWQTAVAAPAADTEDRQVVEEGLRRLQKMYAWGDIDEAQYRHDAAALRATMTAPHPGAADLEAVAGALRDNGPTLPPLMLKSATVDDGRVSEWVVRAELRPLLELCVPPSGRPDAADYAVRFSA
jgi:DNA invertase Pin-like site-specific DNA recombinase